MRRGVQVLKIRAVREFRITDTGMEMGNPFQDIRSLF